MYILVCSVFRSKIRAFLIIILFFILFFSLTLLLNNYLENQKMIKDLEKNLKTRINVVIEDKKIVEKIESIPNIKIIQNEEIFSNIYHLTIQTELEKDINQIMNQLIDLGLNPTKNKTIPQELETYQDLEDFYQIIVLITTITIVIVVIIEIKIQVMWDKQNIFFLNALGYNKFLITLITLSRLYIFLLISFILSTIVSLIIFLIEKTNIYIFINIFILLVFLILGIIQIQLLMKKIFKNRSLEI